MSQRSIYPARSSWSVFSSILCCGLVLIATACSQNNLQNKQLSDSSDEILRLQGVSWVTRKLIGLATITLYILHSKAKPEPPSDSASDEVERIDIESIGTGGLTSTENRVLNWVDQATNSPIFGHTRETSLILPFHPLLCVTSRFVHVMYAQIPMLMLIQMSVFLFF